VGRPSVEYLLGPGWYPPDSGVRWMAKQANLRMGGPQSRGERLYIEGYCTDAQFADGPLPVRISVDGLRLAETEVRAGGNRFHLSFDLPDQLVGRSGVNLSVEVGRTFRAGTDIRDLGLAFGIFEIR
jgi:hypothetical protein